MFLRIDRFRKGLPQQVQPGGWGIPQPAKHRTTTRRQLRFLWAFYKSPAV